MPSINKWERDLNGIFTPVQRKNLIYLSLNSLFCTRIQESNYKLLTQWYYTASRFHTFFRGLRALLAMRRGAGDSAAYILIMVEDQTILVGDPKDC